MDIVGFTSMSKEVAPHMVMAYLQELFTVLDQMSEFYGVYKASMHCGGGGASGRCRAEAASTRQTCIVCEACVRPVQGGGSVYKASMHCVWGVASGRCRAEAEVDGD
eukprot:347554-Chlamydomonas_euryale.AAC.1